MEKVIKRMVLRMFPELSARYHLPLFAQVVNVRETPVQGDVCDEFRPKYAVDVQVLDERGKADKKWPVLRDVMLAVPVAGHEMGFFAYPQNGCWVEIAFAYGSPNKPFIRSVLPHGRALPTVERGEMRWQHNADSFMRIDADGNHQHISDGEIHQQSLTRLVEAMEVVENFHQVIKNTATDDSELIGGTKSIEAMGAMVLKAGEQLNIQGVKDVTITSLSKNLQKAPKTWIGSQTENVLQLLSELMQKVMDLDATLAAHTHTGDSGGSTSAPNQAGAISTNGSDIGAIKTRLDGVKE